MNRALTTLKEAFSTASALALPNLQKVFFLFICEKQGVTLGVLIQALGPTQHPVAYLSKNLDPSLKDGTFASGHWHLQLYR